MLFDEQAIPANPNIRYIGYNIENGQITAEKIYYRIDPDRDNAIDPPLISEMMRRIHGLRLSSIENASLSTGIVKYDFLVQNIRGWVDTSRFLRSNVPYYRAKTAILIGLIPWLHFQFTSVGIRFKDSVDLETELYYRKEQHRDIKPSIIAKKMLTPTQYNECSNWIELFYNNCGWIRSAGVSFKREKVLIKLYLETSDSELLNLAQQMFEGTDNYNPLKRVAQYAHSIKMKFKGLGIVMEQNGSCMRYNFYFSQR